MPDLSALTLDELLNAMQRTDMTLSYPGEPGFIELRRRFDSLTQELAEARAGGNALYHDLARRVIGRVLAADCAVDTHDVELRLANIIRERDTAERELADEQRLCGVNTTALLAEQARNAALVRELAEALRVSEYRMAALRNCREQHLAAEAEVVRLREALTEIADTIPSSLVHPIEVITARDIARAALGEAPDGQ